MLPYVLAMDWRGILSAGLKWRAIREAGVKRVEELITSISQKDSRGN